jgi:glucose/arabinose dehydrogenase
MLGGPGRAHGLNSGHTHDVSALAMSPDGQLIVSASSAEEVCHTVNGLVRVAPMYLWSTRTAAVVGSLMMHSHGIQAYAPHWVDQFLHFRI